MSLNDGQADTQADEMRLLQLVSMFQMAAMQQMGKLVNPVTNEVEKDLDQAKVSIDMIEMLKRKTEGNRSVSETEFLDKVLFELHMNFVDESKSDEKSEPRDGTGGADADTDTGEDADGGVASGETADPEK
jgi:hypothetical protein